jgi:prepilin-type N-terminal cleavage/methylation domain-containing protein
MGSAHRKDPWQRGVWLHPRRWRWTRRSLPKNCVAAGFSLTEMMVVFLMISILAGFAIPMVGRSIEQALVDGAASDLKGLWTAQRLYWLKHGEYAASVDDLRQDRLFTPQPMYSSAISFSYSISGTDSNSFTVLATPQDDHRWSGGLSITQDGNVSGSILASDGTLLQPSGEIGKP